MKADELTPEQAWEDFKSGYTDFEENHVGKDREGDNASLDEKIDVLTAKVSELATDMAVVSDSVPQALGTVEENKTLENELKQAENEEQPETEETPEENTLFDGDDGLDTFFEPAEESEETVTEEESEKIPEEETPEEEIIEKMVNILDRLDKRVAHLERENKGLKKQLAEISTVQTETTTIVKSRPKPNANLRMVKGSYNRPPVSTQHVANQRDIGIGKAKADSMPSAFGGNLNDVFADCERIANQTTYNNRNRGI